MQSHPQPDPHTADVADRLVAEYAGVLPESTVRSCVAAASPRVLDLDATPPRVLDLEDVAREDLDALAEAVTRSEAMAPVHQSA